MRTTLVLLALLPMMASAGFNSTKVCEHVGGPGGEQMPTPSCRDQDYRTRPRGYGTPDYYQVTEVFEDGACVADDPSLCQLDKYAVPNQVIESMDVFMDEVGLDHELPPVSVAVDSDYGILGGESIVYYDTYRTVVSPPAEWFDPDYQYAENVGSVSHELGHHIQEHVNGALLNAGQTGEAFPHMVVEGLADVISATWQDAQGAPDSEAWVVGEDSPAPIRDHRQWREIGEFENDTYVGHTNGRILGNMFWRLRQLGVTPEELFKLAVDVFEDLPATGLDWTDIWASMSFHTTTATRPLLEQVWDEMGGTTPANPASQGTEVIIYYTPVLTNYCTGLGGVGFPLHPWTFGHWPTCIGF